MPPFPRPSAPPPRTSEHVGSVAGHFGELLQGRLGEDGPLVLVTLPAPVFRVTAWYAAGRPFALHCLGGDRPLLPRQAAALHRALLGGPPHGRLVLRSQMPVGGGAGSSTATLLAVAHVFAAAAGRPLPEPGWLARVCLAIEGATDPLMHRDPARLLWAPRQARVIARLPPPPPLEVVGGFLGPGLRTDPSDRRFADIADLVAAWAPAAARGDAAALAALATESARRNARCRAGPDLEPLLAIAERVGALGVVAAHTGSARGMLFAPGRGDQAGAAAAMRAIGARAVCRFRLVGSRPTAVGPERKHNGRRPEGPES